MTSAVLLLSFQRFDASGNFCTDPQRWHRRDPKIIFRAGKRTEVWNYDASHRGEAIPELNSG